MKSSERMMTTTALYWLAAIYAVLAVIGVALSRGTESHEQTATQAVLPTNPTGTKKMFRTTGFCPGPCCCGGSADGITASGHRIKPGDRFCAAPRTIPFGTLLDIPGYGKAPVLDRGGAIVPKGSIRHRDGHSFVTDYDRIDLYFDTHKEALKWGVQILEVTYGNY